MVFAGLLASSRSDRLASRSGGAAVSSQLTRPRLPSLRSSGSSSVSANTSTDASSSVGPSAPPSSSGHGPEHISDESQLRPMPDEPPDLRELNNCLDALAAVFPDVQVDVFREMLTSLGSESRLNVVADALLKNRTSWVKGRWKVADATGTKGTEPPRTNAPKASTKAKAPDHHMAPAEPEPGGGSSLVPTKERFRSPAYKEAVKALAFQEFKGLSRSTIVAVLAEQNYSYLEARDTLAEISSKSWRFAMASFFRKKPAPSPTSAEVVASHPLVVWKSSGKGSILPTIKATGSPELDRELYAELVAPLKSKARVAQEEKDRVLAIVLNMEEAEETGATHECACCFTTATFEEITTCNTGDHVLCFRCVQHSISEAVFGQGWQRSIDRELGTLRCPAVDADECPGCIPVDQMHRAMLEEKNGAEVLHRLDQRLAEHTLIASGLPLVRCPFCSYAEVDDLYLPAREAELRLRADGILNLAFLLLCVGVIPFLLPVLLLFSFGCLVCVLTASVSFVKTAGCNKLTCPCGYKMCYVCRKDIGGDDSGGGGGGADVGYRHFCDHFRPEGDPRPCDQCNRCNLWESENTEEVLQAAKDEAERKWLQAEGSALDGAGAAGLASASGSDAAMLGAGAVAAAAARDKRLGFAGLFRSGCPTLAQMCDAVVNTLFV
ncbi:hypothetical protein MAPG_01778 [Magnaporthiopsis poae ATCC 64411]|uniref:RING-type domain-containing protein n=1 Tax=Magnaporthiopsis poae (strain ATCC 64411 / 73-15) TaxID=644358 RepID=A0A0C4DPK9_MAGP6|nr:hypothetical protein MAPG_01778 [Magnaporthiopsis poae ATCC 64411]